MSTVVRTGSMCLVAAMMMALQAAGAISQPNDMLDREQAMMGGTEVANPDASATDTVEKAASAASAAEQGMPADVGDAEGLWTRVKKAFAFHVQPQKENNKTQLEVNVLMVEGRELFRKGEYRKALDTFKEVVQRDPYNITARRYIKECQESLMKITVDDFDVIKRERLYDVDKTWLMETRTEKAAKVEQGTVAAAARDMDSALQQKIPSLKFTDAKVMDVFDYLRQNSEPKVAINIADQESIKKLADANQDQVTLHLNQVPLIDVVKYICQAKGLMYRVVNNQIEITGKESQRLRPQVFQLSRRSLADIDLGSDVEAGESDDNKRIKVLFKKIGLPEVKGATAIYNRRQNRLIVTDTDANIKVIEEFIKKYDETPYQVQIEARFVTIQNDDLTQLVFRHFLERNYTWDYDRGRYNDRYNITAPNLEREMTPGLRYIRSYMNEDTYDPLLSSYEIPTLAGTGNSYDDYLATKRFKPNMPEYGDLGVNGAQTLYKSILLQQGLVDQAQRKVDALQTARNKYMPASPEYALLDAALQNAMTNNGLSAMNANLQYTIQQFNNVNYSDKVANDGLGKVMDVSGVLGPAMWRSVIYALDNAEGVHTIFAPKVTVKTGQRAEIKDITKVRYNTEIDDAEDPQLQVGDAFQYITDYAVTPKNWEDREYGTTLKVTPSVQVDGRTIELDVQPEVSDLVSWRQFVSSRNNVFELPQFYVQSVRTLVKVNDGDTVVMGGLMRDQLIRTDDKVPILGDLPLIGRFWRSNTEVAKKSNLMIFINAKLIDPSGQMVRRTTAVR